MTTPELRPIPRRFEAEWRERFHEFAEERDDDAGIAGWTRTGLDARLRRFVGVWKVGAPGERWLDAGCGAGTYSRLLAAEGMRVVGTDYSQLAVEKARRRSDPDIAYLVADVRQPPFAAQSFDGVVCLGVMQALSASAPAIQGMAQLVKPGGQLWVDALNCRCIVHVVSELRRRWRGRPRHLRYDSPTELRRAFRRAGLVGVELHWMPILPTRWQRWQPWVESAFARAVLRHVPFVGTLLCHAFIVRGVVPKAAA